MRTRVPAANSRRFPVLVASIVLAASCGVEPLAPPVRPDEPAQLGPDAPVSVDNAVVCEGTATCEETPGSHSEQPAVAAEDAPDPTPRLSATVPDEELRKHVEAYFAGHIGRRIYVQADKPLYQPGETIWIKAWDLSAPTLAAPKNAAGLDVKLISPRGSEVATRRVNESAGGAAADIDIPAGVPGGEYTLRATAFDGTKGERTIVVNTYEAPRVKKKLEFLRKAYGEGDEVVATIEVKRPTGEPLANQQLTAVAHIDGEDTSRTEVTTNDQGGGLVRFKLPAQMSIGDGLLTVMVDDGGVTESISKRIPIVLRKMQIAFFPEGGDLVEGLPTRVYFEAKNTLGKPADVEGRIVDDLNNAVATFKTFKNGLGRFNLTPATGRRYHAEITRPVGVEEKTDLPLASSEGCVLRTFDDPDGQLPAIRAQVRCTDSRKVVVAGMIRENLIDAASVDVAPGLPAVVALTSKDESIKHAQGVARVTVFDEKLNPLAERIVFRNRRARLHVEVKPDHKSYSPRDPVTLAVRTTDSNGAPVSADLAVSVVDDTVISYADDKSGHLLSQLLLESELPGKIEEPNFYFDLTESKSAVSMDLLMGTHGYRRFEWQPVIHPPPPPPKRSVYTYAIDGLEGVAGGMMALARPAMMAPMAAVAAAPPPPVAKGQAAGPRPAMKERAARKAELKQDDQDREAPMDKAAEVIAIPMVAQKEDAMDEAIVEAKPMNRDFKNAGAMAGFGKAIDWAPVRVFPIPAYTPGESGTRSDFRETIFWSPAVHTDSSGKASVKFVASDAVTSFRIFTEGVGSGLAGRDETVFKSNLPFSLSVKLPMEVSAGDKPVVPVTLTNETTHPLDVTVDSSFGSLVTSSGNVETGGAMAAGSRRTLYVPLEVTGVHGESEVRIAANTGALSDEFKRTLTVTPLGFPQVASRSGQVSNRATQTIDLGEPIPGSLVASVKLYPSPVATMQSGLEGLLREPGGCFEQTSSTNYPNVMVMQYLKEHDVADPALIARSTHLLDDGYKRLSGFEAPHKGYEWFGGDPGHEALTAYGLLEFADMKQVYPEVDGAMIARTAEWLRSRRDGNGGYLRDGKALDSFGRASPEVTSAYITYALVESGENGLDKEIAAQSKLAAETSDPYLLALATGTLLRSPQHRSEGISAAKRLAVKQSESGEWTGADHSITKSGGLNLTIETTSLALLSLIDATGFDSNVRRGVEWLNNNRGGFGAWGTTQATVLALKAMTAYSNASRKTQSAGSVKLVVNGEPAGEMDYEAGRRDPVVFTDIASHLHGGSNTIEIDHDGEALPYSLAVEYRSIKPATSSKATIALTTSLERSKVKMGETVRLNAVVTNRSQNGQPMTIARVGLPAGLSFQTWQLKELREKGAVAFYETHPREVTLYFRDMKPGEEKRIPIDLIATVPGSYTGPASSAYLYYTDEFKSWTDGLPVEIAP